MREGGEWEGREKRGKGREESGEGRGKWGQKEFDEKTNKQTNRQTNTSTKTQKDEWEGRKPSKATKNKIQNQP